MLPIAVVPDLLELARLRESSMLFSVLDLRPWKIFRPCGACKLESRMYTRRSGPFVWNFDVFYLLQLYYFCLMYSIPGQFARFVFLLHVFPGDGFWCLLPSVILLSVGPLPFNKFLTHAYPFPARLFLFSAALDFFLKTSFLNQFCGQYIHA